MGQYATIVEAQAYMDTRLNAEPWDDADPADQDKALMMATTLIERLNFRGEKADSTQELQFPRGNDTVVPQDVKNACAEVALALLDGVDPEMEFDNLRMKAQAYGVVKSTYDTERAPEHYVAGIPSSIAWRFLKPYLRSPFSVRLDRVS